MSEGPLLCEIRNHAITQNNSRSKEVKTAIMHFPFSPDLSFGQFTESWIWSCSSVTLHDAARRCDPRAA